MAQHIIYKTLVQRHTINPIITARQYSDAETSRAIDAYQSAWDNGESFIGADAWGLMQPAKRETDSEAEINACADQLNSVLLGIIKTGWAASLSRADAATICNALGMTASIAICGAYMNAYDIVERWNSAHVDQHPLIINDFQG